MPGLAELESMIDEQFMGGSANNTTSTDTTTADTVEGGEGTNANEQATQQAVDDQDPFITKPAVPAPQQKPAGQEQQQAGGGATAKPVTQPTTERQTPAVNPTQRGRLPADAQGNLVDPVTGLIVAKAGKERSYYEIARDAGVKAATFSRELDTIRTELNAFKQAATLPRELGLLPAEVSNAMQFMAHFKANPVEAAQRVLTEVMAMGHNIEGLGAGVDMAALKQLVTQAVQPFHTDRDAQLRQTQAAEQTDRELEAVFNAHPWAEQQTDALQSILDTDKTLSLREATLMLKSWALERGYDINQPLRDQHLAAQNGAHVQQQHLPNVRTAQQRNNQAQVPAPNTPAGGSTVQRQVTAVNHDVGNKDIVRQAFREAGLNIDF